MKKFGKVLHPHLNDFINIIEIETLSVYRYITAVIIWIETEQERKPTTIWAINALFQLINVTGEKPRINTEEKQIIIFTEQDIWQKIVDICLETMVILLIIISLKSTSICPKRQCLATSIIYSQQKRLI